MNPSKFQRLGLCEAAQAIRRGDLRSEDLIRALLERIEHHENTVQAFQWLDPARALDLACQADRRLRAGEPPGPLHGIPIGIKDIIETQGIPTTMGSPIFEGYVPECSAALVKQAEAAGRITEPLVWVPTAPGRNPMATAAAEPLDDPPGVWTGFHGLRVLPGWK